MGERRYALLNKDRLGRKCEIQAEDREGAMSATSKWYEKGTQSGTPGVYSDAVGLIAECGEAEHAARIVKAVNSYDALLTAAKAARPYVEHQAHQRNEQAIRDLALLEAAITLAGRKGI